MQPPRLQRFASPFHADYPTPGAAPGAVSPQEMLLAGVLGDTFPVPGSSSQEVAIACFLPLATVK